MSLEENYIIEDSIFFDTYAFFELLAGNSQYEKYKKFKIITTKLNIFEIYLAVLRVTSQEKAIEVAEKYYSFVVDFDLDVLMNAAKLKAQLNKREVSMTDCIGYSVARQIGIKFLTGDNAFKDLDNVEFVK